MSSYCETSHVQEEFKALEIDTTTAISGDRIDRFIEEESAFMDARIGLRFVTPVTGAQSLILLRKICIGLVAGRLKPILKTKTGGDVGKQGSENPGLDALISDARKSLDMIIAGTLALADAALVSTADGVRSFAKDTGQVAQFRRNERQW